MQYKKLIVNDTIIEFHNNWLGEETVVVNGQVVSKKSSIMGVAHHFTVAEAGHQARYVLTSKVDNGLSVYLDLIRDRVIIQENVPLPMAMGGGQKQNKLKQSGLAKLNRFDLEGSLIDLNKALDESPNDPELYFHLACAYSVLERPMEGFESLQKAITNKLNHRDMILTHDMLAYLRMHDAFEDFQHSNYTIIDKSKFEKRIK